MDYEKLYERLLNRVNELESENEMIAEKIRQKEKAEYLSYHDNDYSTDYLYKLIDMLPANVYWFDGNGRMQGANYFCAMATPFKSREKIVGNTVYDFSPPDIADKVILVNKNILITGKEYVGLEEGLDLTGKRVIYHTKKVPIRDQNTNIIGIMGVSMDISKRVEQEEKLQIAKRKLEAVRRAKHDFVLNMSNDIRTPCTGIIDSSIKLYESEKDPKKKEQLGYILESSKKLLSFLDDIFDLIRLDEGGLVVENSEFELRKLVKDISDLFVARLEQKKLKLFLEVEPTLPKTLYGKKQHLHRILINLIGNAIKFTDTGHVTLKLCELKRNENESITELQVEDTGIGIPDKDQKKIFEKFQRLSAAYHGKYEGAGLGLYITYQLTLALNGKIDVKRNAFNGTTFIVTIPFSLARDLRIGGDDE